MTRATGATFRHDDGGSGENPPSELAKICSVEAKDKMNFESEHQFDTKRPAGFLRDLKV